MSQRLKDDKPLRGSQPLFVDSLPLRRKHWAEIYISLLAGKSDKTIAYETGLSISTIKSGYVVRIKKLLNVSTRNELQWEVIHRSISGNPWPYLYTILGAPGSDGIRKLFATAVPENTESTFGLLPS